MRVKSAVRAWSGPPGRGRTPAGASAGTHRWLNARPERWLRVVSFVLPAVVSIGTPVPCLAFVALATLC